MPWSKRRDFVRPEKFWNSTIMFAFVARTAQYTAALPSSPTPSKSISPRRFLIIPLPSRHTWLVLIWSVGQTFVALHAWLFCMTLMYVSYAQDLYSYNVELSSGLAGNNILTVLMKQNGLTIQAAADYAGEHYQALMATFLANKAQLKKDGCDPVVLRYLEATQHWVIGSIVWSFETPRYFGAMRTQIRDTLRVPLKPMEEQYTYSDLEDSD
jgi:hypothetical protein